VGSPNVRGEPLKGDDNHIRPVKLVLARREDDEVSTAFKSKTRARQHQMVYEALKGRMGGELHALALTTSES
jgi:acid stress-induced BolA-like protein IbaG/YrbA